MLNVTGCDNVTMNGLRSLIQGLQDVIEAKHMLDLHQLMNILKEN